MSNNNYHHMSFLSVKDLVLIINITILRILRSIIIVGA